MSGAWIVRSLSVTVSARPFPPLGGRLGWGAVSLRAPSHWPSRFGVNPPSRLSPQRVEGEELGNDWCRDVLMCLCGSRGQRSDCRGRGWWSAARSRPTRASIRRECFGLVCRLVCGCQDLAWP